MPCEVCEDEGTYPVINREGRTIFEITCPACLGLSDNDMTERERYRKAIKSQDTPKEGG